jgi:hypothetical protein
MSAKPSSNAVSITVWDLQGKAMNPKTVAELEQAVETLVKRDNLVYSLATS